MSTQPLPADVRVAERSPAGVLPLTRNPAPLYALSLLAGVLTAVVAAAGLLWSGSIYPTEEVRLAFLPVDLFHLVAGVPVLLGCVWLARRGSLAGLLCWPGALLYVLYSYITNLLGVAFGILFLPYVLLVTLSAYTTIALMASIDAETVRRKLQGRVPARAVAGLLLGLTGLFLVTNLGAVVSALAASPPAEPAHPLYVLIADFTTVIPLCLAGGILLWRRAAWGYAAGAGLLLFYGLLFLALLPVLLYPMLSGGAPFAAADVLLMAGCGLICLALLARYLRGAGA